MNNVIIHHVLVLHAIGDHAIKAARVQGEVLVPFLSLALFTTVTASYHQSYHI